MTSPFLRLAATTWLAALLLAAPAHAAEPPPTASGAPTLEQLQEQLRQQQQRLLELERLLAEQGKLLEALRQQVATGRSQSPAPPPTPAVAPDLTQEQEIQRLSGQVDTLAKSSQELQETVNAMNKENQKEHQGLGDKLKGLGNFSFSGDVRLRYEPFFGGTLPQDRHRERVRLRFNALAKFSDELTGGLSLASGDELDPISTNQTLTGFFERKPIALDRAFLEYRPHWFKPLTLTGGKFAYTWYHTELTWDIDLNPEGFSEALAFDFQNPVFKKLTLVGFQLPFRETGNFDDSFVHGGQVQSFWKLGERVKFSAYASFYNWHRADPIRAAQVNLTAPVTGGACALTPGCTVTIPNSIALAGNTNTNTVAPGNRFASQFGLFDAISRVDIDTGRARWPLLLQLDFVNNTRACANVFVATCNPHDRQGYWAEVQLGQTKEPHDFNFGYTLIHIEQEAVLAAFNFSDLRQPTNVVNHRFNFGYQAYKNVTLNFTALIGRALVTATSPVAEPWLKRLQLDVLYKF